MFISGQSGGFLPPLNSSWEYAWVSVSLENRLYDMFGHALAQEPLPPGSWNLQFSRTFLAHPYYKLSLSDLGPGVFFKIDFQRNNAVSLYDIFIHALVQEHPVPGVMKFTILVDTTLVILTINLIFCKHKTKEEDFF